MKRSLLFAVLLLPALTASAQTSSVAGAESHERHTIIAASGDPSPAGGNYLPFSFLNARLNARHEVVFDAFVGGPPFTSGVFAGDGKTTSTIALGINPDPAGPSFGSVGNPFIASNGQVVFRADPSDIFTSNGRTIAPLARSGDPAPGGGTLFPAAFAVNDHSAAAYGASIGEATATRGIFRSDGSQTVAIVRDDITPPTGGSFTSLFGDPVINDRGQVAFFAEMIGGQADFGIFRGEGGDLTPVFIANQIAPGGATFEDFSGPKINRHGDVAAFASLTDSAARQGLFVGDGTDAIAIALEGQSAPKGGSYADPSGRGDTFRSPFRFNDRGEVAFDANLNGSASASGIFRGNGHRTTTIALAGTAAAGTTGTFESFGDIKLGNDGRVAFIATLTLGAGGVDPSNNMGIWVGTSDRDLQLVARTGEDIGGKVLTRLPILGFGFGSQFDMNENDILWVGNFGSVKAVVLSRVGGMSDDSVTGSER